MDDCEICDGDYDDNVDVVLDAGVDAGRAAGDLIRRIAARRYQRLSTLRHLRTIVAIGHVLVDQPKDTNVTTHVANV